MLRRWIGLSSVLAIVALASVAPISGATRKTGTTTLFYGLEFPGIGVAFFSKCSGLGSESRPERGHDEHRSEDDSHVKFVDLVCTRGLTSAMDFWNWRNQVEQGESARRDGTFTAYDETARPVAQWQLTQAWPREVTLGDDGTERIFFQYEDEKRIK